MFGATYAGGEETASDDAETAAFYTLGDMTAMPVADAVFEVAEALLGTSSGAEA